MAGAPGSTRAQVRRWTRRAIFVLGAVVAYGFAGLLWSSATEGRGPGLRGRALEHDAAEASGEGDYPTDLFSPEQRQQGWIVLHCIGVLYMFVALNEVCDSFFVPALEVLVDAVNMDMTVAGATFMAAGGSAPELFTSFLGVFVSKNNVGFGTIVGSAVFNVLFVIGVCAIAASGKNADGSRMALELTPYPLFRDSMWYILSLLTLVLFFLDQKIEWWEALLQFFVYVGYVAFMMKNAHFEKVALQRCPCLRPRHPAKRTKWVRHAFGTLAGGGGEQGRRGSALAATAKAQPQTAPGASAPPRSNLASASAIRVAPAPSKDEISDFQPDGAKHAVADGPAPQAPAGDTEALVSKGEAAGSPKPGHSWKQVRQAVTRVEVLSSMIKNDADEPDEPEGIPEDYFTWPSESDTDEDGELLGRAWLRRAMFVVVAPIRLLLIVSTPDPVPKEKVFLCWSRGPCDILCGPESADSSPAKAPAARSKPDAGSGTPARSKSAPTPNSHPAEQPAAPASTKEKRKTSPMFLITFVLSIVWIGVFSYLMVWWATLAGVVFGMPPEVMGLTFLAAGTSVPDLLTSVIVASKGFGDMAVSSSIGSNVFDVTVGLPLPWLLGTIAFGQPIDVASDGLFSSVLVLFLMLILVVISIAVAGWKLSLSLGAAMFLLYGLFVAHSLLTEYGVIPLSLEVNASAKKSSQPGVDGKCEAGARGDAPGTFRQGAARGALDCPQRELDPGVWFFPSRRRDLPQLLRVPLD